jgi:predicted MFS family arabinose efflux permease
MQLFLLFFVGAFSGRAMDAGYYRYILLAGQACQLIAVFTTSTCTKYYQFLLVQGLLQGLGNGLVFCPTIAHVSSYFPLEKRAIALSLFACGGASGGMVFPAMAQNLLPKLGYPWTVRCMGFVMLATCLVVQAFSRSRPTTSKANPSWLDPTAFRDTPYLLFCVGIFLGFWGIFFAYFYVRSYGQEILGVSEETSFTLLLLINAVGIPGRVVPNYLSDRYFGALNVQIPFVFASGILLFAWIAVRQASSYYVWVAFYGFFGGGSQSLFQAASSSFNNDPEKIGVRIGMVCTVVSFACLSGAPIAGKLLDAMDGSYLAAQIFNGVVMLIGSAFLLASKLAQKRKMKNELVQIE